MVYRNGLNSLLISDCSASATILSLVTLSEYIIIVDARKTLVIGKKSNCGMGLGILDGKSRIVPQF